MIKIQEKYKSNLIISTQCKYFNEIIKNTTQNEYLLFFKLMFDIISTQLSVNQKHCKKEMHGNDFYFCCVRTTAGKTTPNC